ncbi:prephenate dehydrogenase/arogenate dehydrogenase family protein [Solidesulfovibrio sp.]
MMNIGYLGPQGSYTHQAVEKLGIKATCAPYHSIQAVFDFVLEDINNVGVVPYENIIEGVVSETIDLLREHCDEITIVKSIVLPIEHALGVLESNENITMIASKDQALRQCSAYINRTYNDVELIEKASTTLAMESVSTKKIKSCAVIGRSDSLAKNGFIVIDTNIGNIKNNKTKFIVIKQRENETVFYDNGDATLLLVHPNHDRAGLLHTITTIISQKCSLNILSIFSRPDTFGGYSFYIELEGGASEANVSLCLATLSSTLCDMDTKVKNLGSYQIASFNTRKIFTIGIVGGLGVMGKWFADFFSKIGYKTIAYDLTTNIALEQFISYSDVILINVPINVTVQVIKDIAPLITPGKLIVDNTSVKKDALNAMLENATENVELLSMHTIFGPSTPDIEKQNIAFIKTQSSGTLATEFINIFIKYGAKISYPDAEYHDKQMAFHQNLVHLLVFVLGEVLIKEFESFDEIFSYSSPNSLLCLSVLGRLLDGDPALYCEIQKYNSCAADTLLTFQTQTDRLVSLIRDQKFDALYESLANEKVQIGTSLIKKLDSIATKIQNNFFSQNK